jgi:hemerythrin
MAVVWDPALALGHAEIDAQHAELFRRYGALVEAMESGGSVDVGPVFDYLVEYAATHFAAEERVMAEARYPAATVHAAAHARFVRELAELRILYDANGPTTGVAVKTRTWILDWLRAHIMGVDLGLARFLRGP